MSKLIKNGKADEPVTKKEFNERLDKVDQRFDKVDQRLDKVDQRLAKVDHALENQAKALMRNTEDIQILKETTATKDDVQKILSAIDSFAQKSQDLERKAIVNTHRINEMESKLEEHEKRINRIETARH